MITEWDYTDLANAYLERPDYSADAIDAMLSIAGILEGAEVCDVGAGVAHLTLMLASRGLSVAAVEPNDAMRSLGRKRTKKWTSVQWKEGTGEATEQPPGRFNLVTFGSSFNVCDMVQNQIDLLIKEHVPTYGYGSRREDQRNVIEASNLFNTVVQLNAPIIHEQTVQKCVEAWRSHATLARQAGDKFEHVVDAIEEYLHSLSAKTLKIPYLTNIWMAQLR